MNDSAAIRPPSASVEDYVKAIWEVAGAGAASTKDVADRLLIAPPSVTSMFVRLQEMGFVEYERSHALGESLARSVFVRAASR